MDLSVYGVFLGLLSEMASLLKKFESKSARVKGELWYSSSNVLMLEF